MAEQKKVKVDREELKKRYQKGVELMSSDDESEVHRGYDIMGELAAGGYADAQIYMGQFVENRLGQAGYAFEWYRRASLQGRPLAYQCMANLLATGRGIAEDVDMAMKCYKTAAEGGLAESQFILGTYHLSKMERTEAKKWLDMAAEQGHEGAIACLKESFANGIGDE